MEIKEYLDKYGIVGVVSNYKISLDLDSTVSDLNIKNFEKACKMVKIDENILNKKLSELSVSELFKVEFMSKLDKKVIIIGNMSSRLILKDIEYFKKLIIKLNSEYNKKFVIIDKDIKPNNKMFIKVQNTNDTYYQILNNYYNYPLDNLKLVGITGTDGKTTTAMIINDLLNNYINSSYLGTNGFVLKEKVIKTKNTTPSLDTLFKYFNILNKNNYNSLIMEVSSEAMLHNRCHNINFDIAILTNINKDHLNIHKTFKNYLDSKTKLFKQTKLCILNKDDKHFNYIKKRCNKNIITYGISKKCNYYFYNINEYNDKTTFNLKVNN